MTKRVRLVEVQGDQEEFADLLGKNGFLEELSDAVRFKPDIGDSLSMLPKKGYPKEKDGKLIVRTELGNKFTFLIL